MSLRDAIRVIVRLADEGVIRDYAVAGAVAALNYIQPTLTEDLDILVSVTDFDERKSGLLLLSPIEESLRRWGYSERSGVGIMVEGWPVQLLPVASPLDQEALEQATDAIVNLDGNVAMSYRTLRAEHVVATALQVGRLKDFARIEAFLDQDVVDLKALKAVLMRHALTSTWKGFCAKAGINDPLEL